MKRNLIVFILCLCAFSVFVDLPADSTEKKMKQLALLSRKKDCTANLKTFYASLKLYAAVHDGELPAKNNLAGLKELLAHGIDLGCFYCSQYRGKKFKYKAARKENRKGRSKVHFTEDHSPFVYIGGINLTSAVRNTPKLMIMCSKPNSKHWYALLADGSVVAVEPGKKEPRIESTSDIVEYLNRKYKYPTATLRALRSRAKSIDANLRKSSR